MVGPSSSTINSFSMFPNPSSGGPCNNGSMRDLLNPNYLIAFAPQNNEVEDMHGYLNNDNVDFSKKNLIQCGVSSQPYMGPSLSPPVVYESTQGNNTEIAHQIITKGQWTQDEDRVLIHLARHFGHGNWSLIAELMKGRVGKQCRDRWNNHLRPNIKKDSWTDEEDKILIEAHKEVGNKWTEIAKRLSGRTENSVKNHWNATKRRKSAKRQRHMCTYSNGTLLHNYIMQVTASATEKELKKTRSNMTLMSEDCSDVGVLSIHYIVRAQRVISLVRIGVLRFMIRRMIKLVGICRLINRNVVVMYVSMMVNSDEIMVNGSIMDDNEMEYEDAIEMGRLVPETKMKRKCI